MKIWKFFLVRSRWLYFILVFDLLYMEKAFAQPGKYNSWHIGRWMMNDCGMGWFGMIFMLLFWGLVIFGLVFLIRWLIQTTGSKAHPGAGTGSKAMDILKERYARGEIARDEFESLKKDILQ